MDDREKFNAVNGQQLNESGRIMEQKHEQVQPDMCAYQYLPVESFDMILQSQLQGLALYDKNEQREIAKHRRAMERDTYRSNLKCQEAYQKQRMREIHEEILPKGNAYYYIRINGNGNGLRVQKVFLAKILNFQCFRYQGSTEILWQITLIEENGGKKVSPLYVQEDIKTLAKLKRTILMMYDNSNSTKSRLFLWEWLRKELMSMLNDAEIMEIPSAPGWYKNVDYYHFYTMADEDTSKFSRHMYNFDMFRDNALDTSTVISSLLNDLEQAGDSEIVGLLLLYRFRVLFGRLTGKNCFRFGLVIYGDEAEDVTYYFLRTMKNELDTMNLDSDQLGRIKKRICGLQDTSAIFLVAVPENKSVQNRLREAMSWMQTSCIGGKRINVQFVFCFKRFSAAMPLENMLVVNADSIRLSKGDQLLDMFQCLVIERIEQSGRQWIEEIANRYEKYSESGMDEAVSMAKMVVEVLLKMFDDVCISQESFHRLRILLEAGERAVKEQLSMKTGRLSEIFRDQVNELVDARSIKLFDRERAPVCNECNYIYFDAEYYYFTNKVLDIIADFANMDRKAVLSIKQDLYMMSKIKTYKKNGCRWNEMNIDFRICNAYGQRKDLSGMAVLREFWDEIGGIALCERG